LKKLTHCVIALKKINALTALVLWLDFQQLQFKKYFEINVVTEQSVCTVVADKLIPVWFGQILSDIPIVMKIILFVLQ